MRWFTKWCAVGAALRVKPVALGFTLIELLIVVAIIGILAAVAIPNFMTARMRARIALAIGDERALATALESYLFDHQAYPGNSEQEIMLKSGQGTGDRGLFSLTTPRPYISRIPVDRFQDGVGYQGVPGPLLYEFGSGSDNGGAQKVNAYILFSNGPDKLNDSGGDDHFPFDCYTIEYDATNGVISQGDIVRLGGFWNQGRWIRNGVPIGIGKITQRG